jgi:hypothetical protein
MLCNNENKCGVPESTHDFCVVRLVNWSLAGTKEKHHTYSIYTKYLRRLINFYAMYKHKNREYNGYKILGVWC